jgi:rare lipoprotein A
MVKRLIRLLIILLLPATVFGREATDSIPHKHHHHLEEPKVQYGIASYYANKFEGRKTYTDEIFRQDSLTAASNTLPMQTWVKVTNLRNHKSVYVRINDKMHPRNKRLIDLSRAAAVQIGFAGRGLTKVRIDVLGKKRPPEADDQITNADVNATPDTTARRPGLD